MQKVLKHTCCRNNTYGRSNVKRFLVPDEFVFWDQQLDGYDPPFYEADVLKGKPWADPNIDDPSFSPSYNEFDSKYNVNRKSHTGLYEVRDKYPLNPFGRTGIKGRGILGRYGPNHAADPVVTKWKRDDSGEIAVHGDTLLPILEACLIERHDCREWAIPGGMVDPGENVPTTLKREFMEEVLSINTSSLVEQFFNNSGTEIYERYVDDPRNTDNAWMETVAYNFHDETGEAVGKLKLKAGDDARNVKWIEINKELKLYASHSQIIKQIAEKLGAHF